jgi:hypothetical protein
MMAMTTAGSKRKVLFLHVGGYPHAGNRLSAQRPHVPHRTVALVGIDSNNQPL